MQVKIGVAGVGSMGMNHCRNLQMMKNVDFLGVFDVQSDRSEQVARAYQVFPFESYQQLLASVDAVILAVPTYLHYLYTRQAIEAGKHVLVEKPFVTNPEEADNLLKLAEEKKTIILVGHVERFNSAILQLEEVILPHKMTCIETRRLGAPQRSLDVDVILDVMIHDIDIVLHLANSPLRSVVANGVSKGSGDQLDIAMAILSFENGIIANLVANRISQEKVRTLSITEKDRYLFANYLTRELYVYQKTNAYMDKNMSYRQESLIEKIMVPNGEPLFNEIQHFITCIHDCKQPCIGPIEATKALEVAWQIKHSIRHS